MKLRGGAAGPLHFTVNPEGVSTGEAGVYWWMDGRTQTLKPDPRC